MDTILQGLAHVASIQDDVLITGEDDDKHLQNLDNVLRRVREEGEDKATRTS